MLFCYISPTSGHRRAAEAVMSVLRHGRPPVECEGVNSISYANPVLGKIVSRVYLQVLKFAPQLWDFLYDNPHVEKATRDIRELLRFFNTGRIVEVLREFRPRCLVCTQAVPIGLLSALKERGRIKLPLVGILTDFGVHGYWISPHVDLYLVPTEEARRGMVRAGVAESRLRVTGIPVDPHFGVPGDRRAERLALGLSPNRPTVLVMGGSYGLGPVEDVVALVRRLPAAPQVIVVCGTNRRLLSKIHRRFAEDRHVRALGQSRAIHRLMDAADLLISKPGGLTTAESLAKGVPLVIVQPIPGQEERNAQVLLRHGAAERAENLDDLGHRVQQLLIHRLRLERLRENGRSLARPRAAHDAADAILELLEGRPTSRNPGSH